MNDTDICCSLKLNPNKNPQTNRLFTKRESNIKNNLINECNLKMKPPLSVPIVNLISEDSYVPIIHKIDNDGKNKSIEILKTTQADALVHISKSPQSPPRRVPSPTKNKKSPIKANKKMDNLNNMKYDELKKKYGNKIKSKMSDSEFLNFKKANNINLDKYLSRLTKNEYILLILYLNL